MCGSLKVIRDALLWTGSYVEVSRCRLTGGRGGGGSLSDACLNITDLLVRLSRMYNFFLNVCANKGKSVPLHARGSEKVPGY